MLCTRHGMLMLRLCVCPHAELCLHAAGELPSQQCPRLPDVPVQVVRSYVLVLDCSRCDVHMLLHVINYDRRVRVDASKAAGHEGGCLRATA